MSDGMQGAVLDFDLSDEEPTYEHVRSPRDWAIGTQPLPIAEVDVHVRLAADNLWHRRLAGVMSTETACGRSADPRVGECNATRFENYRGPLCPYCFTAREFAISNEITQED